MKNGVKIRSRSSSAMPAPEVPAAVYVARRRMGGQVSCVYHAYEGGELIATGRLTLDGLPEVGDELRLNGRAHVVRDVSFGVEAHVLTLEAR